MSGKLCPCCKQNIPDKDLPIDMLRYIKTTTVRNEILRALIDCYPRAVNAEFLIDAAYGGAKVPDSIRIIISVHINNIKKIIQPYGWTVPTPKTGRGNFATYKLERLTKA